MEAASCHILEESYEPEGVLELSREVNSLVNIRDSFEEYVLNWPMVETKNFFGKLGYFVNGKLFAFFKDNDLVLTKLSKRNKKSLYRELKGYVAEYPDKRKKSWVIIRLNGENLEKGLVYSSISYNRASKS